MKLADCSPIRKKKDLLQGCVHGNLDRGQGSLGTGPRDSGNAGWLQNTAYSCQNEAKITKVMVLMTLVVQDTSGAIWRHL